MICWEGFFPRFVSGSNLMSKDIHRRLQNDFKLTYVNEFLSTAEFGDTVKATH